MELKCKACGGNIKYKAGKSVGSCPECGLKQPICVLADEEQMGTSNRLNHLRLTGKYSQAIELYKKQVREHPEGSDDRWGLLLSEYGVLYKKAPRSKTQLPVICRTKGILFTEHPEYKTLLRFADDKQKPLYKAMAEQIEKAQKQILTAAAELPAYDIYLCGSLYSNGGKKSKKQNLTENLYRYLAKAGHRVFYPPVTLKDVDADLRESIIFSALTVCRVMLVAGAKAVDFEEEKVKSQWSRFLEEAKGNDDKKLCSLSRDLSALALPEGFSAFMVFSASKNDWMERLTKAIEPYIAVKTDFQAQSKTDDLPCAENKALLTENTEPADLPNNGDKAPPQYETEEAVRGVTKKQGAAVLLKDSGISKEDKRTLDELLAQGDFSEAELFSFRLIEHNEACAYAYLGIIMAKTQCVKISDLAFSAVLFEKTECFSKLMQYADEPLKEELRGYVESAREHRKAEMLLSTYIKAYDVLQTAREKQDYEEAFQLLQGIPGYKDADEMRQRCERKLSEIREKEKSVLRKKREKKEKLRKTARKTLPVTAAAAVIAVLIFSVLIPGIGYASAKKSYKNGDYQNAYEAFCSVRFLDSRQKAEECRYALQMQSIGSSLEVGGTVFFGSYEQDNILSNGYEPIEWQVLRVEDNKALLISKYALDCMPYDEYRHNKWQFSTLREWLNGEFYSNAFSEAHREMIVSTVVEPLGNPKYEGSAGQKTTDKLFIPSITAAFSLFTTDSSRVCSPTAYAVARGVQPHSGVTENGEATCTWWLRSPGANSHRVANISEYGSIHYKGEDTDFWYYGVRPAMWIYIG